MTFQYTLGLLKKLSPSNPTGMERLIHNALRRGALLRNVAFSFGNPAWKFLLMLWISQDVVIASGYNELEKIGVITKKENKGEGNA